MTDTTTCPYCQHTRPEHDQHCLGQSLAEEGPLAGICDLCRVNGLAQYCPGEDTHCTYGEHCTTVVEVCSIDNRRDDHGWRCCNCGQSISTGQR